MKKDIRNIWELPYLKEFSAHLEKQAQNAGLHPDHIYMLQLLWHFKKTPQTIIVAKCIGKIDIIHLLPEYDYFMSISKNIECERKCKYCPYFVTCEN